MSSLGAQARAAEYAAATAARARQVSREAEDQKLPPKATPVSLSAFTKIQPTTRNKGIKVWKPLSLDDIAESSDDGSISKGSEQRTPTPLARGNTTASTSTPTRRRIPGQVPQIKGVSIPTGPRAMMTSRAAVTVVAHLTPQKPHTRPVINLPIQQFQQGLQGLQSSPSPFGQVGGCPHDNLARYLHSLRFNGLVTPSSHEAPQFQRFGSTMVPDDISPTKQEEKFAFRTQAQSMDFMPCQNQRFDNLPPHMTHGIAFHELHNSPANAPPQEYPLMWDVRGHDGAYSDYTHEQPYRGAIASTGYERENGGDSKDPEALLTVTTNYQAGHSHSDLASIGPGVFNSLVTSTQQIQTSAGTTTGNLSVSPTLFS